jgi:hypothetical protein
MDSDSKISRNSHVDTIGEFNKSSGLPFEQVLSSQTIVRAIVEQKIDYRKRSFPPDLTLWTFLSQSLGEDKSCQSAVARLSAFLISKGETPPSPNTAAYCKARGRLPEELIAGLTRQSGKDLEEQIPKKWLWRERHIKLLDGTTVSMPDTPENQKIYPQVRNQKPGVGFPLLRIMGIISCATGAVKDVRMGSYYGKGNGELGLLRQLLHNFKRGDVVLGDSYYCTFYLIASLSALGVDVVFPMYGPRNYDLGSGQVLGKEDHVTTWIKPPRTTWIDQETYDAFPESISVRETRTSLYRKGFRSKSRVLVTTFLNPKKISVQDLAELYARRWFVEVDLRSIKQTMKMDVLRGRTPEMVRKEIWMGLLAYNLIRKVMAQASHIYRKNPRQLSFKLTLQMIKAFRNNDLFCESQKLAYPALLKAITYKIVGNRQGRYEPRRVKRRPKAYPLLQKVRHLYTPEAA